MSRRAGVVGASPPVPSGSPRTGGLDREILALALPAIGSGLTLLGYHWIDTYWIARHLGEAAMAALSISTFTVWIYGSLASLVGVGITALVARYCGAGREDGARYVALQGLLGGVVFSVLLAGVGWLLAPLVFEAAGATGAVARAGTEYVRTFWAGGVAVLAQRSADAVFRARGLTWIPFAVSCVGLALNAALDPLFILGAPWWPALSVRGAALATVLAQAATAIVSLAVLVRLGHLSPRRPADEELRLNTTTPLSRPGWLGLDPAVSYRIARVGLPIAASGVFFSTIYVVIARIVEEAGGTSAQAGLGLGLRGESLAFVLCTGFAVAASSLVGRRLGAGDPGGAARAAWRCVLHCAIPCAVWGLVLLFLADELATLLIREGPAHQHARDYFWIISLCLVPMAFEIVLEGAFGGAGLTLPPMLVSVSLTVVRIPVAIWAAFDLGAGVRGIFWTISITAVLRGVLMAAWFARGTWKTRSV